MKVGLLTYHYLRNYGAVAQAYCLYQAIQSLGHEPTLIHYIPYRMRKLELQSYCSVKGPLRLLKDAKFRWFIGALSRTQRFVHANDPDLSRTCQSMDAIVVGSDEVWRVSHGGLHSDYFLDFVPDPVRRVSYAPSFGSSKSIEPYRDSMLPLLERFQSISVRDHHSVRLVNEVLGREPQLVLDPTFLAAVPCKSPSSSWIRRGYLLVYGTQFSASQVQLMREIKARSGLQVVSVGHLSPVADLQLPFASVVSWAGWIRHASAVLTNYFHGTVLSIQAGVPFLCLARADKVNKIGSILALLGLEDRWVVDDSSHLGTTSFCEKALDLDYQAVNRKIQSLKQSSLAYLEDALKS